MKPSIMILIATMKLYAENLYLKSSISKIIDTLEENGWINRGLTD